MARCCNLQKAPGFTLIELLVAMAVMALIAVLGWRTMAGMEQALAINRSHVDAVLTLEAAVNQWVADLDAVLEQSEARSLVWDGRSLRITRRGSQDAEGAVVVAWVRSEREGEARWLRWQSAPVQTLKAWESAWAAADAWAQGNENIQGLTNGRDLRQREVNLVGLANWTLLFYRGNAWTNPLSSKGGLDDSEIPDGVRLTITLPEGHPLAGVLVRDWARITSKGQGE